MNASTPKQVLYALRKVLDKIGPSRRAAEIDSDRELVRQAALSVLSHDESLPDNERLSDADRSYVQRVSTTDAQRTRHPSRLHKETVDTDSAKADKEKTVNTASNRVDIAHFSTTPRQQPRLAPKIPYSCPRFARRPAPSRLAKDGQPAAQSARIKNQSARISS